MLGIPHKVEFGTFLTRALPVPVNYIDSNNAPDIFDSGVIPDEFKVEDIKDGDIKDSMLADASITTEKLADFAVDTSKLADLAVEAAKLANSAVTSEKVANAAIGSAAIATLAVGTAHIAHGAILDAHIANATITSAKIQSINANTIITGTLRGINVEGGVFRSLNGLGLIYTTSNGDIVIKGADDVVLMADNVARCQVGSSSFRALHAGYNLGSSGEPWNRVYANRYYAEGHSGDSGEFDDGDGNTIEVTRGLITGGL